MYSVLQLSQLIRNVWICGRIDSSSIIAHPIYTTGTIAKIRCQEVDISIIDRYNSFDNRYGFIVSNGNTSYVYHNVSLCHFSDRIHVSLITCSQIYFWGGDGLPSPPFCDGSDLDSYTTVASNYLQGPHRESPKAMSKLSDTLIDSHLGLRRYQSRKNDHI